VNALPWTHPEWGAALALLCALAAVALAAVALRQRRRRRLLGWRLPQARGAWRSDAALWLALALLALALAGPRVATRVEWVPASGVDVVFAVDVSSSMDAQDVAPSRLHRARRAVLELLARLESADRFGLVAFAGRGALLAPLTPDRDAVAELVGGLDTQLVAPASSRLDEGVRAALAAFEPGSDRPRVLFVLSDGEDPERHRDLGAADARRADVRVLVAGFGSEIGAPLFDHGTPLLDAEGRAVVSRRNLERLELLAVEADGALFPADAWGEIDFDAAAAAIRRDAGTGAAVMQERRVRAAPVAPLAALALLLLAVEGLQWPRAWSLARGLPASAAALAALGLATPAPAGDPELSTLAGLEAEARQQPGDAHALIELGAARLERGQRDEAARAFLAAALSAPDARSAGIAYFDLGVAALEAADYVAARDAFLDALAFLPGDARARFNLEWTLRALEQHPQPAAQPEPPPDAEPKPAPPPPEAQPDPDSERDEQAEPEPPALSPEEQRRWLERVRDDPGRALRAALPDADSGARRGGTGPVW
jgi:Ca-activated chloride channel family protein